LPKSLIALFAVLVALPLPGSEPSSRVRPTLLRLRIVLTTESPAADLTLDTGTIVDGSVVSGDGAVRVRAERNRLSFTHEGGGAADAHVRLLVSGLGADARVKWRLSLSSTDAATRLEVYNENEQGRARLVDRFDASTGQSIFESPLDRLIADGPLKIEPGPRPLVLSFFYPWAQHFNWASDRLQDYPLYLYSTELPDEVGQSLGEARTAGLDGVIVSWRGDTDWNDRRLQFVLDQAQRLGLRVSILVETLTIREVLPDGTKGPVAGVMGEWLKKAFDKFVQHPAFLRTRGRPVIFVYVADAFTPAEWRAMIQTLERSGRNLFLMADSLDPAFLESFSGAFSYATAGISRPDLERFHSDQALRTQSYNLSHGGARRLSAATVSPGYDDTFLERETALVVDRANGATYDAQWQSAVKAQPDWILVTSWNEFWENTHVEPSVLYGRRYQDRTRTWSEMFRRQAVDDPASPPRSGPTIW
jgi:hypothetical protein